MPNDPPIANQRINYAIPAKPLVLVGMMGAGKSYIGAALAKTLGRPFVDSDKVIEQKAGMAIPDIFEKFGEAKFRESEKRTILEALEDQDAIIATGGGALYNSETLNALKENSLMIWLDADLEILWQRVQKSENRPLLHTDNPKERLSTLKNDRQSLYQNAHIQVKITESNANKSLELVLEALKDASNTSSNV